MGGRFGCRLEGVIEILISSVVGPRKLYRMFVVQLEMKNKETRRDPRALPKYNIDTQTDERFYREYGVPARLFLGYIRSSHSICLRFEQEHIFATRDGTCEREGYLSMSNAKQAKRVTAASRETLITILETLPGALLVVDDADTIVYANASAQA